ncbi:MAG: four helix bundle protein [bacterium]|nr:four helix bundle protein [bacterium]
MNTELRKGKIRTFRDLYAWQEAHKFVLTVYALSKKFPKEELFALTNQLRRAVVSITSNIAEGFSRTSYKEKANFYAIGLGSLTESQNQLIIALDLDYITKTDFDSAWNQSIVVSKLVNGLLKSTRSYQTSVHNS